MPVTKTLRSARRAAGLTQTQLAERSGVSQTYISDLEASTDPNPTVSVVRRLQKALRCVLDFTPSQSDGRAA